MVIVLEKAKDYYLCPIENESLHLIGDKNMMNFLATLMDDGDVVIVQGVPNEKCFLMVEYTSAKCEELIAKAMELFEKSSTKIIEGEITNEPV